MSPQVFLRSVPGLLLGAACLVAIGAALLAQTTVPLGWPEGFASRTVPDLPLEKVLRSGRVEIRVRYPADWVVIQANATVEAERGGRSLITLGDATGSRFFTVMEPMDGLGALDKPLTPAQFETVVGPVIRGSGPMKVTSSGQVRQGTTGPLWLWIQSAGLRAEDLGQTATASRWPLESVRTWGFFTVMAGHLVNLNCAAMVWRGEPGAETNDRMARSGIECGEMVRRLSVQTVRGTPRR